MWLALEQVRDNCKKARLIMPRARNEHRAFGAFHLDDEQTIKAVAQAAQNKYVTFPSPAWPSTRKDILHSFRGSSVGSRYSRPSGPMADTWVT
jgi:hypothetical protein